MGIKYCVPQTVHMDTTPEKRMKFAEVIIRKCDEVSADQRLIFTCAFRYGQIGNEYARSEAVRVYAESGSGAYQ